MASSAFHLFPELPTELRLCIWELALRPLERSVGIHHLLVGTIKDELVTNSVLYTNIYRGPKTWERSNRMPIVYIGRPHSDLETGKTSVHLWDLGLWMACKESNYIIKKHRTRIQEPLKVIQPSDEPWSFVVDPRRDILCLHLQESCATAFLRVDVECHTLWSFMNVTCNAAVEFDPNWLLNWPERWQDLRNEHSIRGLFCRMVYHMAWPSREWARPDRIWLVDREANVPRRLLVGRGGHSAHDLHEEYFETLVGADACTFVNKLGRLYVYAGRSSNCLLMMYSDIWRYVGVLAHSRS